MPWLKRNCGLLAAALLFSVAGCAPTSARQSTGAIVDDTDITMQVKTAILSDSSLQVFRISVETYRNVVQLSGFVSSGADMDKAVQLARTVDGVRSVRNDMRLR